MIGTNRLVNDVDVEQAFDTSIYVDLGLQQHWDSKLSKSPSNPFPLAPKDLVNRGLVTEESYKSQNDQLAEFRNTKMTEQLESLSKEDNFFKVIGNTVEVWGAGLFRGFLFLMSAVALRLQVIIRDNSEVACQNANEVLDPLGLDPCQVIHCEVEAAWDSEELDRSSIVIIYLPQFIQVQAKPVMKSIMSKIGGWLREPAGSKAPKKRVYLMHARLEDNIGPRTWEGVILPRVQWGDTTPYSDHELIAPTEEGLGGEVEFKVLGRHYYFHQCYSLIRIMAA